jgi:hypothetical protein
MNIRNSSNRAEASDNRTQLEIIKQRPQASFSPINGSKNNTAKLFFKNSKPPLISNYNVQNIKIDAVKEF